MFRIKENPDGSVSIFSNDENQEFLCSIAPRLPPKECPKITEVPTKSKKPQKENLPKSPTRLTLSPGRAKKKACATRKPKPAWHSNRPSYECSDVDDDEDDDDDDSSSVASYDSTFSLASTISVGSTKEPDEDCIDQYSFCQMLDLVESKRLVGPPEACQEIKRSFPIRKISCQSRWQDPRKRFPKQISQIGFSTQLGQNILCAHPTMNSLVDPAETLTSKYDKFCKRSITNVPTILWSAPSLRTRENKARYPVTFKKTFGYVHKYSFSKKQRKRRAECLNLGLSQRSYILKSNCRKCFVSLEKLSRATIDKHCNPPSCQTQRVCSPSQELCSQEVSTSFHDARPTKGFSRIIPLGCLGPKLVTAVPHNFGLAGFVK